LRDLPFRGNQPPKSADAWCIGILKSKIKSLEVFDELKKKTRTLGLVI
jgi:hypothetical protein